MVRRGTALVTALLLAGCGSPPPRRAAEPFQPYRFDDHLAEARVSAASPTAAARAAAPLAWRNFFSAKDVTWIPLRGRLGFRAGDLMVQGEDGTPVILSPVNPPITWNAYEAVEIRMRAEAGREVKIKIGDREFRHVLGPPARYNLYRFDILIDAPAGSRPLAIMPTDSPTALVAIRSIELIPRRSEFTLPAGRWMIGKSEEYRNAVYAHTPSRLAFEVTVPPRARLHFGLGIVDSPVTFRVATGSAELYSRTITSAEAWEDARIDLSTYSGRRIPLAFETSAVTAGAVGLWANPILTAEVPGRRPNVLLYMIDTLRADHTSLYGYARDTTPFLKKLGATGLVFEDATAQATWTKPSTASLLTSLYSFAHGIVRDYDTIPQGATTLAERLRQAGYTTASFLGNPYVGRLTGLQRGFDYLAEWGVVERYRDEARDGATDSAALNRVLFPWLEKHRGEPFFLYAHAMDPHSPYRPPPPFDGKFAEPALSRGFDRDYARLRRKAEDAGGVEISRAMCKQAGIAPDPFIRAAVDRYDGEVLHNDSSLEQLVDKLKQLGILEDTLIVVVSDHGEEFWDHGWTAHGHSLYPELAHVVLLMWNSRLIPTPRRVAEPVQLIDVMPTVLDLLGLPIPGVLQGQSLAPLARGTPFQRTGAVMASRYARPDARPGAFPPENRTNTVALFERRWSLIYRDRAKAAGLPAIELYDRRADPANLHDVSQEHLEQAAGMLRAISRWTAAQQQVSAALGTGAKAATDTKTLERLRSLGYLGGR